MDYYQLSELISRIVILLHIVLFWGLVFIWIFYILSSVSLLKVSISFYEGIFFCFLKAVTVLVIPLMFYSLYVFIALNSYGLYKIMCSLSFNKRVLILSKNLIWIR